MVTAKRLYLYVVSGVGLALVIGGATTMLRLLLAQVGVASYSPTYLYGPLSTGLNPDREALSAAIGMMAVGLPLWLIHWALVQRMTAGDGEEAAVERNSIVRSAYFSLVLIYLLVAGAVAFVAFLREGFARPLGATDPFGFVSLSDSASTAVIYLAAWLVHAWWRARDLRRGPLLEGAAAWIGRLYLYGAALIAVAWTLGSAQGFIGSAIDAVSGHIDSAYPAMGMDYYSGSGLIPPTAAWWVRPILSMLAQLVVWAPLWALHWFYSVRLAGGEGRQARAERASDIRFVFFVAVVALGVSYVAWSLSQGLAAVIGAVVGVGSAAGPGPLWRDIVVAPVAAIPLALAWWWHRRRVLREAADSEWQASPARVISYLTALIGLGQFGGGLAAAAALILQRVFAGGSVDAFGANAWRWQTAQAIAFAVVALAIWLWPWLARSRQLGLDREAEARTTARRAYLFVAVGVAILASAGAAAFIVYRVTRLVVGLQTDSLGSEIGYALGVLIVVLPLLAYHLVALRADLSLNGESTAPVAVEARPVDVPAAPGIQELVILGPAGVNLEALKASLAGQLPAGCSIQVRASGRVLDE